REFSKEKGIEYIPLAEELLAATRADSKPYFFAGDIHLNEDGHVFLADLLEPIIKAHYRRKDPGGQVE
ncbi:MAG: hypothetical protein AB1896_21085, partial [Thermodesulfobacteriota bacterium]